MLYLMETALNREDSLHIVCSTKDIDQEIRKDSKNIKVLFQTFDISMKSNHPKSILNAVDKESLNICF